MYAVIQTGGKQYRVQQGDVIFVEKLDCQAGDTVSFDRVLLVGGEESRIGTPVVQGASVETNTRGRRSAGWATAAASNRPPSSWCARRARTSSARRYRRSRRRR